MSRVEDDHGIDGKEVALKDQPRPVYVLDFWSIACPPCHTLAPQLQSIHEKYGYHEVRVVGVNLSDSATAIRKHVESKGYTYIQATDKGTVANAFGIYAMRPFAASDSGSFWYLRVFRQVFSTTCWISRRLYTSSPTKSESRPMLLCAPSLSPTYPQLQTMGKPGMAAMILSATAKGP